MLGGFPQYFKVDKKCLHIALLSNQKPKAKRLFIYPHNWQRKAENLDIDMFLLKNNDKNYLSFKY